MVADKEKLCKEELQHSCKTNIGKTTVERVERGSGEFRRQRGVKTRSKGKLPSHTVNLRHRAEAKYQVGGQVLGVVPALKSTLHSRLSKLGSLDNLCMLQLCNN